MNRKLIDHNGRVFGLISLIDLLVIAIVAVVVYAVYVKFNVHPVTSSTVSTTPITYQVTIENMPQGRMEALAVGDKLYDKDNDSGASLGEITKIEVSDCTISTTLADGTYVMAPVEGRYKVVLTVETDNALESNDRYYINRTYQIAVGQNPSLYTRYCLFDATVTALSESEAS